MSLAENHVATCYPLGGTSRRRRMLAIRMASPQQPRPARQDHTDAPPVPAPALAAGTGPLETGDADDSVSRIRLSGQPLTWMFLGESFLPTDCVRREWPGFVELFTTGLRNRRPHANDPVVDACTPGFRARDVLDGFSERIERRNPSIIFLLCGPHDPDAGMRALAGFEDALLQFARHTSDAGILLVLNTSPVPWHNDDHPSAAEHLIYAEAVRNIAAELQLPLVDHRREWEEFAIPPRETGSWFDADGRYPGAHGHRRIASKLLSLPDRSLWTRTGDVRSLVATLE